MADARRRLLAPGGTLIPREDSLWVAVVEAPDVYRDHVGPWQDNELGLDMGAALRFTTNSWGKARLKPGQFLVEPRCWAKLDYTHPGRARTPAARRPGRCRGRGRPTASALWFDAELVDGIGYSNAPGATEQIYGQAFFPLTRPLDLDAGDTISVGLRADLIGEDYQWTWETRVGDRDEPGRCPGRLPAVDVPGRTPRSLERLKKQARRARRRPSRRTA